MAKKGMKKWFGFGKKEAADTNENEVIANEEVTANSSEPSTDKATAQEISSDVTPESTAAEATEVKEVAVEESTVETISDKANSEKDTSETENIVEEHAEAAEQAEVEEKPEDAPKWYQFGKKKQLKAAKLAEESERQAEDAEQGVEETAEVVTTTDAETEQTSALIEEEVKAEVEPEIAKDVVAEGDVVAESAAEGSTAEDSAVEDSVTEGTVVEETMVEEAVAEETAVADEAVTEQEETVAQPEQKEKFFARLKRGLSRTKGNIGSGFKNLFRGKHIDDELFEELEEQLLVADIGVETTMRIIDQLTQQATRKDLKDAEALYDLLKKDMAEMLEKVDRPLEIDSNNKPHVILMVGVNGVGKTTTIGKMAKKFQAEGKSVMLAAGDTFRAAAVEQLQVWGERNDIPVVAQHTGADSASVLFDAMQSASAKNVDVLIADTAGRLQNKAHLMEELKKVVRVMKKHDATAPHEIMLTIDAGTGQNALSQAEIFNEAVGLTGITLTKLDGTAKGGVIFAVADKFEVPIRFIGIGEGIDDLRTFNSEEFIEALFSQDDRG